MEITLTYAQLRSFIPASGSRIFYETSAGNVVDVFVSHVVSREEYSNAHFIISPGVATATFTTDYPEAILVTSITEASIIEPVSVDDNAGSLTVDAPIATPVNVQIGDGTRIATVRDTGASDSLNVAIVDGSGAHITSFGGGTQYTEGDVDASITGTAAMWEDTGDTLRAVSAAKPLPVGDAGGSLTIDGTVTANPKSTTSAVTSVSRSATNVTLLASNANRIGATIYQDSASNLFIKLGATATTSSFTVRLSNNTYYEVPFGYTGIIDGIWGSAGGGNARITELT